MLSTTIPNYLASSVGGINGADYHQLLPTLNNELAVANAVSSSPSFSNCVNKSLLEMHSALVIDFSRYSYIGARGLTSHLTVYELAIRIILCLISIIVSLVGNVCVIYTILIKPRVERRRNINNSQNNINNNNNNNNNNTHNIYRQPGSRNNLNTFQLNNPLIPSPRNSPHHQPVSTRYSVTNGVSPRQQCRINFSSADRGAYVVKISSKLMLDHRQLLNQKLESNSDVRLSNNVNNNNNDVSGEGSGGGVGEMVRSEKKFIITRIYKPYKNKPVNIFILNLCICDLMITVWCSWVHLINTISHNWQMGAFFCSFNTYIQGNFMSKFLHHI
jgi:hypothetical protein